MKKRYTLYRYEEFALQENYDYYLKKKDGQIKQVSKTEFLNAGLPHSLDSKRIKVNIFDKSVTGIFESTQDKWEEYLSMSYDEFYKRTKDEHESPEWNKTASEQNLPQTQEKKVDGRYMVPIGRHLSLDRVLQVLNVDMANNVLTDSSEAMQDRKSLVIDDRYILFGRENWMASMILNTEFKCPVVNIPLQVKSAESAIKVATLLTFTDYGHTGTEKKPENDIFTMSPEDREEVIKKFMSENKELMETLQVKYADKDLRVMIMRYLHAQGKKLLKRSITEKNTQVTTELERLNENAVKDTAEYVALFAGVLDPTPTTDLVTSAAYFANGQYMMGTLALVSAVPYVGDAIAKPIMFLLKSAIRNKVVKKTMPILSKAIKELDVAGAVRAVDMLPNGKLKDGLLKFMEKASEWLPKLASFLSDITKKIGEKWDKLKWVYALVKGWSGFNFFRKFSEMYEKFIQNLTRLDEDDIYGILSNNLAVSLDRMRKLGDELGVDRNMPLPELWAIPEEEFRQDSGFDGIPVRMRKRLREQKLNVGKRKKQKS
jgi:hypothetical protein